MKKLAFSIATLFLICSFINIFAQSNNEQESNKKIASKYHELNSADIDDILSVDFVGQSNEMTWGREDHRQALNTTFKEFKVKDKIVHMVAELDMVALKIIRMGEMEGKPFSMDLMQFMRIVDGKITEIWEVYDAGQYESQID